MKKYLTPLALALLILATSGFDGCIADKSDSNPQSASGVKKASVQVETDSNGHTVEQNNIAKRLEQDNKPGSIKHLYVISAYSGQTLLYSTVQGKVTSSGKRLTPTTVTSQDCANGCGSEFNGMNYWFPDGWHRSSEVTQDDGTFGSSDPYIFWFDSRGVYHQHYLSGGQIVHVSSEPINVKGVVINLEER